MADRFDYLIVGQGLAGTTLAWQLRWAGFRTAVIDRGEADTASRVAAGLITPITGRRLAASWRYAELFPVAEAFYRRVETETGSQFYARRPIVRLFRDDRERTVFAGRVCAEFEGLVSPEPPLINDNWFSAPAGGFEMTAGGQLVVTAYLDASRAHFFRSGEFCIGDVRPDADVELVPCGVRLPRLGLTARAVIFCQGIDGATNSWFRNVRFSPAKGEILTLRIPNLAEDRVVNRGVWLAPTGEDTYRAGSTYDREDTSPLPTALGREEIGTRLREYLRLPFDVIGHAAAVRPITAGRRPLLGLHPADCRVGYFNGLGSKGAILAPFFAGQLARHLNGQQPLDSKVDVGRAIRDW